MKNYLRLSIKERLYLVGVFTFLSLGIVFTIIYITNKHIDQLLLLRNNLNEINTFMLKQRKDEKDFIIREISNDNFYLTGESKYISSFLIRKKEIEELILFLRNNSYINSFNLLEKTDSLSSAFEVYSIKFLSLTEGIRLRGNQKTGLLSKLESSALDIENELKNAPGLYQYYLKCYQAYTNYNQVKNNENAALCNESIEKFIDKIPLGNTGLLEAVSGYSNHFNQILKADQVNGMNENEGLLGELRNSIHRVEPLSVELISSTQLLIDNEILNIKTKTILLSLIVMTIISIFLSFYYTQNKPFDIKSQNGSK